MPGNDPRAGVGHGENAVTGCNHAADIAVAVHIDEGIETIEEIVAHVKDIGLLKMEDCISVGMPRSGMEGMNGLPVPVQRQFVVEGDDRECCIR